jgi:GDP-D-mannose 3', 5'-epimerase
MTKHPIMFPLDRPVVVTGAGGFIGHHLVKRLRSEGAFVVGIDVKDPEWEKSPANVFRYLDLRSEPSMAHVGADVIPLFDRDGTVIHPWVFHLAADMGGIGYIESHKGDIVANNTRINLNMLDAARKFGAYRFLFSSSACVYPGYLQNETRDPLPLGWSGAQNMIENGLAEHHVYPALPEDGYGWEKLYTERLCRHYAEDFHIETRVARFHNVYGPNGTYDGGREKSPAAICRKVAKLPAAGGEIEVWGDGTQVRSYMHVDDCVEGLLRLMMSSRREPLNLGTDEAVTINELVELTSVYAHKVVTKRYDTSKPQGVKFRNADLTEMKKTLGWEPQIKLVEGLKGTYQWIDEQVNTKRGA